MPTTTDISRRQFIGTTAAAAALAVIPGSARSNPAKPHSKINGVQIGTITYSFRSLPGTAEDLLKYVIECGISSIELMGDPAEQFAGAPVLQRPQSRPGEPLTAEQRNQFRKARKQHGKRVSEWRRSTKMEGFAKLRKMYNDAGVDIHIVKFGGIVPDLPEE